MSRQWDPDSVPDSNILPKGWYRAKIVEFAEKESSTGKVMFPLAATIEEPEEYRGMYVRDNFVLGTDEDPQADDPKTWSGSISARRLKQCLKKAQVAMSRDLEADLRKAIGQSVMVRLTIGVDKRNDTPQNNVSGYKMVGEVAPGIEEGGVGVKSGLVGGNRSVPPPAPPPDDM